MFLLQKETDAPNGNLNHQDTHNCENQDVILNNATILSHTFVLPQLIAEHNCEDLEHTDDPSTVSTLIQATSDQTFNPRVLITQWQLSAVNTLTLIKIFCCGNDLTPKFSFFFCINSCLYQHSPCSSH